MPDSYACPEPTLRAASARRRSCVDSGIAPHRAVLNQETLSSEAFNDCIGGWQKTTARIGIYISQSRLLHIVFETFNQSVDFAPLEAAFRTGVKVQVFFILRSPFRNYRADPRPGSTFEISQHDLML